VAKSGLLLGRLTAGAGSSATTSSDHGARPPGAPEGAAAAAPGAAPVLRRTFEFRLVESEAQDRSAPLPGPAAGGFVVAANHLRVYLVRGNGTAEPREAISGVEVAAQERGDALVCSARVNDLGSHGAVVVQIDVAAHAVAS
jgi:hypothetical protein